MTDNKELYDDELEFDDEIDFEGLEDYEEEPDEYEIVTGDKEQSEAEIRTGTAFEAEESEDDSEAEENEQSEEHDLGETAVADSEVGEVDAGVDSESDTGYVEEDIPQPVIDEEVDSVISEPTPSEANANISVNRFCVINTAISAVTLCAVAAGIAFGYNYISSVEKDLEIKSAEIAELKEENQELEEEYLEAMNTFEDIEEEKLSLNEIEADNGKVIFYDTSVGYSWMPVLTGIKQNDYINSNFSLDNRGRLSYTDDGEDSSYFGIDVSSYQGDIDWQLVKEDNVEFAFLRIGYRGYGEEGKLCPDEKFIENYDGAHDAGIDLGVYFFSQAATVDEAVEEANYVLSLLEGRTLEYPIVFDWETVQTGDPEDIPRTEDVMPSTLTLSAIAFCETIRDAGYDAMIYTNKKLATIKYDLRRLQEYPIWLAYYDTELNYCYDFDIWQYGTGQVDGIEGEVDVNIAMIK